MKLPMPPEIWECDVCGCYVFDRELHNKHHLDLKAIAEELLNVMVRTRELETKE